MRVRSLAGLLGVVLSLGACSSDDPEAERDFESLKQDLCTVLCTEAERCDVEDARPCSERCLTDADADYARCPKQTRA
jgi:hypothetical protein